MKIIAIAIAAIALLPVQASAKAAPDAQVVRVSYADLNLATEAGVRTLDRRLAAAIRAACPDAAGTEELARVAAAHRCVADKTSELKAERNRAITAAWPSERLAEGTR